MVCISTFCKTRPEIVALNTYKNPAGSTEMEFQVAEMHPFELKTLSELSGPLSHGLFPIETLDSGPKFKSLGVNPRKRKYSVKTDHGLQGKTEMTEERIRKENLI